MNKKDPIICTYPVLIRLSELENMLNKKDNKDKKTFISIIEHRLSRRFLKVIDKANKGDLSSFLSMAICCFLIETLECFYQGLENTEGRGEGLRVFKSFFKREEANFPGLYDKSTDFYYNVRCGLLHQAETKSGWFLNKNGKLLELSDGEKTINGKLFYEATKKSIENYLILLEKSDFTSDDKIWENAFKKLIEVCKNCKEIEKPTKKKDSR
ncbi:MAG TPA: hypothetical protein PKK00_06210 [Bacteroidales bacterium]|nr:hypothetical protein [Bacteroidales bacterium]HPS16883.1 hypothetical protein [Bacteroidales bacterium]